jgi:hypothetical protein
MAILVCVMKYEDRQIKQYEMNERDLERLRRRGKFEKRKGKKKRLDKGS